MKNISCKEMYMNYNNYSIIIDLRPATDFNKNHIPNSYNIPYELFIKKYAYLLNRNNLYYLICESGKKSKECGLLLSSNGYKVINIYDGFINWKGPLTKSN